MLPTSCCQQPTCSKGQVHWCLSSTVLIPATLNVCYLRSRFPFSIVTTQQPICVSIYSWIFLFPGLNSTLNYGIAEILPALVIGRSLMLSPVSFLLIKPIFEKNFVIFCHHKILQVPWVFLFPSPGVNSVSGEMGSHHGVEI